MKKIVIKYYSIVPPDWRIVNHYVLSFKAFYIVIEDKYIRTFVIEIFKIYILYNMHNYSNIWFWFDCCL